MLKTIKIKNVALISEATVNFCSGLNIISGETGAGKSVLLDCIGLILGAKADKTLIKNGEEFLKVEGIFEVSKKPNIEELFNDLDLEFDECLIISRKVTIDGKNEVKLNGQTVPLSFIKNITKLLIDIHSQNENLVILNKQNQLKLLDNHLKTDFSEITSLYNQLNDIKKEISGLDKDDSIRARELELLDFQIKEIEDAKIKENEEDEIKNELILLKNLEKVSTSVNSIKDYYDSGLTNISSMIKKMLLEINNISKYNDNVKVLEDRINSAYIDLDDSVNEILNLFDINFDENHFNELDERLDLYKSLHKKYGNSYEDITKYLCEIKEKRDSLINAEERLNNLNKLKNDVLDKAYILSEKLTDKRKKYAKTFEKEILEELKELSMPNAKVDFKFNDYTKENFEDVFTKEGADIVELMFSANLGESVKPLNLVASGGEISRLNLAIKTLTSENDNIDTMIFDELDTGISGSASVATSKKLAKISKNHQIIAVSHLFQICAMADKNILVKKIEKDGKTISLPVELGGEEAVNELCRFLSVDEITEATITHAKEVKEYLDSYKKSI